MEQLSTLSQTIMALNKKEEMIFRAKFALRKRMPDKKLDHRKYILILTSFIWKQIVLKIKKGNHITVIASFVVARAGIEPATS
jgi:hypothetical protein